MNLALRVLWAIAKPFVYLFLIVFYLLLVVVTLPYTLVYSSANWGMNPKYHGAVEVYLRHFEQLHPDLIAHVDATTKAQGYNKSTLDSLKGWPRKKSSEIDRHFFYSVRTTSWSCMLSAYLLAALERAGWSRKLLWTFLRDTVEQAGVVGQEEKDAFAKAMDVMNSHHMIRVGMMDPERWFAPSSDGESGGVQSPQQRLRQEIAERYANSTGGPVVPVPSDSLAWIFSRGAVLVPGEAGKRNVASLPRYLPMWGLLKNDSDVEKGLGNYWQVVALPSETGK